jgi:hypothetical protein
MKKKPVVSKSAAVTITAPNMQVAEFEIGGTAPLVQNKFSKKAKDEIKGKQELGSVGTKGKKREPKDFKKAYEEAMHISEEGWHGIPAPAFRAALIRACKLVGFEMTMAKCCLFCEPDGFDADEGTPLVKIIGKPRYHESCVRNATGVVDLRARPMWRTWSAKVRIKYDADQFSLTDVANLMSRAGQQVGIGEGRPFSTKSHGMGWGTFEIKKEKAA